MDCGSVAQNCLSFGMEKRVRIVQKGKDESNIRYWASRSYRERMIELEKIRQEVNLRLYGTRPEFQRVYRITQRQRG